MLVGTDTDTTTTTGIEDHCHEGGRSNMSQLLHVHATATDPLAHVLDMST